MIMTRIKTGIIWVVNCLLISGFMSPALALDGFTQSDRERLVRVEAIQTTFMQPDGQAIRADGQANRAGGQAI